MIRFADPDSDTAKGKTDKPRDPSINLFNLLGGVVDRAAMRSINRGLALIADVDPDLRAARRLDQNGVAAIEAVLGALADAAEDGSAVKLHAEGGPAEVRLVASARLQPRAAPGAARRAAYAARVAEGLLEASALPGERIAWRLTLPAPIVALSVLIIHDDRITRLALAELLRAGGYLPEMVAGEDAALRLLAGGDYAATLIDLWLQSADPMELAGLSSAPAFALNDRASPASRWATLQAGFQDLLQKPYSLGQLTRALSGPARSPA